MSVSLETLALAKKFAKTYADGLIGSQGIFMYANREAFPSAGEVNKLYIAEDSGNMYRWNATDGVYSSVGGTGSGFTASIELGTGWSGSGPYTQEVTIDDYTVTAATRVDLITDVAAIAALDAQGVNTIYIENNSGALTAYALGNMPDEEITLRAIITEVEA